MVAQPPDDLPRAALAGCARRRRFNHRREYAPALPRALRDLASRPIKVSAEFIVSTRRILVRLSGSWPRFTHFQSTLDEIQFLMAPGPFLTTPPVAPHEPPQSVRRGRTRPGTRDCREPLFPGSSDRPSARDRLVARESHHVVGGRTDQAGVRTGPGCRSPCSPGGCHAGQGARRGTGGRRQAGRGEALFGQTTCINPEFAL